MGLGGEPVSATVNESYTKGINLLHLSRGQPHRVDVGLQVAIRLHKSQFDCTIRCSDSLSLRFSSFEAVPTVRVANSFDVIARIWAPELPFRFLRAKEIAKALSVSALAEKKESSEIVLKTAATFLASSGP